MIDLSSFERSLACSRRRTRSKYFGSKGSTAISFLPGEREREVLSTLALSFPARERELELLSVMALSSLSKGVGSVFFFLSFFFLSFSRLAFALFGILT